MQRKDPELRLDLKLEKALAENNVCQGINMLAPRYRAYWIMKEELAFLPQLNKELWPAILSDMAIKARENRINYFR